MKYLLGIDIGTSAAKGVIYDLKGIARFDKSSSYAMLQIHPTWAEQDPSDWWNAVIEICRYLSNEVHASSGEIVGIGVTGQMHGLVMLNATGEILRPSIIWCDQRSQLECNKITTLVGKNNLMNITANPALPGFTAPKLLWVKNHEPNVYNRCAHVLLPKDYIIYKLSGELVTDVTDASGTLLLDINKRDWSDELLVKFDFDRSLFGDVYESEELIGRVSAEAAASTGLRVGTKIAAGAGDQAAAAIGNGVVKTGRMSCNIGSSGVLFSMTDAPLIDPEGRVHTFCHAIPNKWHVMSVTQSAGISLEWFRKQFYKGHPNITFDEMMIRAFRKKTESSCLFLPYLMGERSPILDSNARGVFFGIDNTTTITDLSRAVIEGVALSLRHCYEVFENMGIRVNTMSFAGGASKNSIWSQLLANVFDVVVEPAVQSDAGTLGAALLGGVASGLFSSIVDASEHINISPNKFNPNHEETQRYAKFYILYKHLYEQLKDVFKEHSIMIEEKI